jgi:signal transduction histidine kinase
MLAERAIIQTARGIRVAGELLDLSRLDAAVPLREDPVDLLAVASAVIAELSVPDGVVVRLQPVGNGPFRARGDRDAVGQILRIVLDNALRFAPGGSAVTVTPYLRDGDAAVAVCDLGPGVAEQDRHVIFERFGRGSDGSTGSGFGLGLAIGRGLARSMGGDLRLRSTRSPTCFSLELPAWRARRDRPPAQQPSAPSPGLGHDQRKRDGHRGG